MTLRNAGACDIEPFVSRECVAAGVRGGECTADAGGDGFGVPWPDPAGSLRLGVVVPEGMREAG